jgi:DNA-binding NarL/FixJ family response regulator
MDTIRILLVDDNLMFLEIARDFLQMQAELIVVGTAHDGQEALAQAEKLKPDVILLDLNMPGLSGLDAIPKLLQVAPQAKIIALTMMNLDAYQPIALAAGANGFVAKPDMGGDLIQTIRRVAAGD